MDPYEALLEDLSLGLITQEEFDRAVKELNAEPWYGE